MHTRTYGLLLALVCSVTACGDREKSLQEHVDVVGVAALGNDLAYVQSNGVVQTLNVLSASPQPSTTKMPTTAAPRLVLKRPALPPDTTDELLVVSDGHTDQFGQELELPALTAIGADGAQRVYPLRDRGQQMRVSDDGRFAILFNDPSYTNQNALLSNPGEVAIVDLAAKSEEGKNPTIRSLDTVGGPPNSVEFPSLTVGSAPSRFAFFTFPDGASLIDLANPSEPGRKLLLTGWVAAGQLSPSNGFQMVADASGNQIFLKCSASQSVQVVSVMPRSSDDPGLGVSLKQLAVGNVAPGNIRVFTNANGVQLVATLGGAVALVDTEEDSVTTASLAHAANDIYMFEGTSPEDPQVTQRAVVYASGQTRATFVDLERFTNEPQRALTVVEFGEPIRELREMQFLPGRVLVFLSGGGVDILDLATRHWVPIDSPVALTLIAADEERSRVWVSAQDDNRLAYLDFGATGSGLTIPNSVRLDDPVQNFFRMGVAERARVVVTHKQAGGSVTLLDANKPERATAAKLEGFLYSDLLSD